MKNLITICCLLLPILSYSQIFPQEEWEYVEDIDTLVWDMEYLEAAYNYIIDSTFITGLVVVHEGKVIMDFGNIEDNSYIASCRKSIVAMLYGPHVSSGKIDLNKTIHELAIDDLGGLLPQEKKATTKDIISARSGVFHEASNKGDFLSYAPERGSVTPGEYWLYSNWDFNVAEHILEKETGSTIYQEIAKVLAIPLQMEDWDATIQQAGGNKKRSQYMAHHIWFSTRDMARIGWLMLNKGKWNNAQILDEQWVDAMIHPHTTYEEINNNVPFFHNSGFDMGYGYMWWLWANQEDERLKNAYSALGALGQGITVFPELDLVVAYKTNSDYQRRTSTFQGLRLVKQLEQSYIGHD